MGNALQIRVSAVTWNEDLLEKLRREGMELLIMSRMKREVPLVYTGPAGVIYAVYFTYNENIDAGAPLIGVCPQDQLPAIQEVIMRVQTEWTEKD